MKEIKPEASVKSLLALGQKVIQNCYDNLQFWSNEELPGNWLNAMDSAVKHEYGLDGLRQATKDLPPSYDPRTDENSGARQKIAACDRVKQEIMNIQRLEK
jgi:hypothetical protein